MAGKELLPASIGPWIRPVSASESGALSNIENQYADGSVPCALDILDLRLFLPRPKDHQQENWLLDSLYSLSRFEQLMLDKLGLFVDPVEPLWLNYEHTNDGYNDKISLESMAAIRSSLRLIRVETLTLTVFKTDGRFGNPKRRIQARFHHDGDDYCLSVTDMRYEHLYLSKPDGDYPLGACFLTISLSEPFRGACYKLVAAIIEQARGTTP